MNFLSKLISPFRAKAVGDWTRVFADTGGSSGAALGNPYANSAWVHSAVRFVSNPISQVPLVFTEDRRGGDVRIEDPALTAFWERPGVTRGGKINRSDFIEATVGFLKLYGEAFWVLDDSWLTRVAAKSPLILARPSDMHEIIGGDGRELIGWQMTDGSGRRHDLIPGQVVQLKMWNPYHDFRGLAEWQAAMISADADYAAGTFARNLARNNGDRGPYVIGKNGIASDEQQKQITAMLRQKREMASRGDFRAVFLTGDIEIKEPTLQAVDAAYVSQRLENRKEVYAAFGVPPSFADSQASYSVGSASDRFKLIEETCMPLAAKISDAVEIVSAMLLGTGRTLFAEFDWDEHSTMQQVRGERFESAVKAIDRGMPWVSAGEYFRLGLPRFAGDDVGRIPYSLQEVESQKSESLKVEEEEEDPVEDLVNLFAGRTKAGCTGCAKGAEGSEQWKQTHAKREPWEKKFASSGRRLLMAARSETLRKIGEVEALGLTSKDIVQKYGALDLLFDLGSWLTDWTRALAGISRAALERAGFEVWTEELERTDPLTLPAKGVLEAIQDRENKISGAGEKIHADLRRQLEEAISQGETMDEIRGRVKRTFNTISSERIDMIARTETTAAYEVARDMSFREAGVEWTQWLTMADLGDRHPAYSGLHNQIRAIDEPFTIYGSLTMRFPGDPEGPAAEVINCRCVRIAVLGPDPAGANNDPSLPY
jgi:HK97 family phage portal protein